MIVPLRAFSCRDRDLSRLRRLLNTVPTEIEIVVADDSPALEIRQFIGRLIALRHCSKYVNCYMDPDSLFSIGRLRDEGVAAASSDIILLHDVDFIAPEKVYKKLLADAIIRTLFEKDYKAFCCIPVLFTSPIGWLLREALGLAVKAQIARKYLRSPIGLWLGRLVLGSSAIMTRREHYLDIGGHSAMFKGHGAEDFELLDRLASQYPLGKKPGDYQEDCGTLGFEARGFRGYFARYGRVAAKQRIILMHQWHPKRKKEAGYLVARQSNFKLLYSQLSKTS